MQINLRIDCYKIMLKIINFIAFAIIFANGQESDLNEACGTQIANNYYYSKDVNPVAGPTIQTPADVLQGRPGKVGARGFKGDRGDQGEPGVPDNSVVELLRSELANLTMRVTNMNDQNRELTMRLANVEDQNRELTMRLADATEQNSELTTELHTQINNIRKRKVNITTNCNDNDVTTSGVYYIRANLRLNAVYCEVETVGRNWLVFQKRIDGSVDFYRNWTEYQHGFGNVEGNYWLGLDAIHAITSSSSYQLRVDLEDWNGDTAYASYSSFSVGNEASNYRLSVSGYSGNAGDSLARHHNNHQFSTMDRDNDGTSSRNCAVTYHGAWWYNNCHDSNLNGKYQRGLNDGRENRWWYWRNQSLKRSVMKIRPN